MCTLVSLKVLNANLTGFKFRQNLLLIWSKFERINQSLEPPPLSPEIIWKNRFLKLHLRGLAGSWIRQLILLQNTSWIIYGEHWKAWKQRTAKSFFQRWVTSFSCWQFSHNVSIIDVWQGSKFAFDHDTVTFFA